MNKSRSRRSERPKRHTPRRHAAAEIQYLLKTEQQILRSISTRAPLIEVLDAICSALDCQIGNVASFISLLEDNAGELSAIDSNAELFSLYAFSSEGIVGENQEFLGSLEMYRCILRNPSAGELQLIERAKCLAAIAIQADMEASGAADGRLPLDLQLLWYRQPGGPYVN